MPVPRQVLKTLYHLLLESRYQLFARHLLYLSFFVDVKGVKSSADAANGVVFFFSTAALKAYCYF